jgi:hypothetical protein
MTTCQNWDAPIPRPLIRPFFHDGLHTSKKNRNPPVMAIPNMYPLRIFSKGHIFYIYIFISYVIIYTYISYNHMCIYIYVLIYSIQYCLNLGIEAICIHFPCCGLKIASIPSTFQAQKKPQKMVTKSTYTKGHVSHRQCDAPPVISRHRQVPIFLYPLVI